MDIWLTASVVRDEHGRPHLVATTERDISDRLRNEQRLRYTAMRLQEADRRRLRIRRYTEGFAQLFSI